MEPVFIAKDTCGCTVAALFTFPDQDVADKIQELSEFLLARSAGQSIEVAAGDTRVGVTVVGGCPPRVLQYD